MVDRIPCCVDPLRCKIILDSSTTLLPLKGTLLMRFDGVTGEIVGVEHGTEMHVSWDNGTNRVYSVRYAPII